MSSDNETSRSFTWNIYTHSDNLQAQRHANFITAQAFLFAAAGLSKESGVGKGVEQLIPLISLFGSILAVVWWLSTVRLESPQRAILNELRKFPEYQVYDKACWKVRFPSASFLMNHLPPALSCAIWVYIGVTSMGWWGNRWWTILCLLPVAMVVGYAADQCESHRSSRFTNSRMTENPIKEGLINQPGSAKDIYEALLALRNTELAALWSRFNIHLVTNIGLLFALIASKDKIADLHRLPYVFGLILTVVWLASEVAGRHALHTRDAALGRFEDAYFPDQLKQYAQFIPFANLPWWNVIRPLRAQTVVSFSLICMLGGAWVYFLVR